MSTKLSKRDREFLLSMVLYAIDELERQKKPISQQALLDYLFADARHDPEAVALEAKVSRVVAALFTLIE